MKTRKTDIPSIIPQKTPTQCYFCRKQYDLQKHHVIAGKSRNLCVQHGLWVWLCPEHHSLLHDHNVGYKELQAEGQKAFIKNMKKQGYPEDVCREEWFRIFGKFYD